MNRRPAENLNTITAPGIEANRHYSEIGVGSGWSMLPPLRFTPRTPAAVLGGSAHRRKVMVLG
jgi:hypothetical protein